MTYILRQFGQLIIPPYLLDGDAQDMGTGGALTSFLPLPGGGYYDNYQSRISPQGIRPLHKSGVFLGNEQSLREQLDAWRAMLGHRERLTVEFDDGKLRWQWARLQDVSTPRGVEVKGGYLPFSLTWITAAQNWRGAVASDWTWGDSSWSMGDGSAHYGQGAYRSTFAAQSGSPTNADFTFVHNGSIDATNLKVRLDISGPWQNLRMSSRTTGQTIEIVRTTTTNRPWVEIDAGARTIFMAQAPARLITGIYRDQNRVWVITDKPHGMEPHAYYDLTGGRSFRIEQSGAYDGTYFPAITVYPTFFPTDANRFYFDVAADFPAFNASYGGKMTALYDLYDLSIISDRRRWLVLAPGENTLSFAFTPVNVVPTTVALTVEFTDHHA